MASISDHYNGLVPKVSSLYRLIKASINKYLTFGKVSVCYVK
jgi:hypothetical protein